MKIVGKGGKSLSNFPYAYLLYVIFLIILLGICVFLIRSIRQNFKARRQELHEMKIMVMKEIPGATTLPSTKIIADASTDRTTSNDSIKDIQDEKTQEE